MLPIRGGMPQTGASDLDVSTEEERYLRGAFRRFALPYLIAVAVFAAFGGWAASRGAGAASAELEDLHSRIAGLSERLEAVGGEVATAGRRVAALENGPRAGDEDEFASLRGSVLSARNRIADLEQRIEREDVSGRVTQLSDRLNRLEQRLEAVASAAPTLAAPPASSPPPILPD